MRGGKRGEVRRFKRERWTTLKTTGNDRSSFCSPSIVVCERLCRCIHVRVLRLNWILSFPNLFSLSALRAFVKHWAVTNRLPGTLFSTQILLQTTLIHLCGLPTFALIFTYIPSPPGIWSSWLIYVGLSLGGRSRHGAAHLPVISKSPRRRSSSARPAACNRIFVGESRAAWTETYWSLSVRSINAGTNLASQGYEQAARVDIRRADLSLSLFISCLACNHPVSAQAAAWLVQCRINSHVMQTAKSCRPLILNDSSCITETILFALLTEGCLKVADEEMELQQ